MKRLKDDSSCVLRGVAAALLFACFSAGVAAAADPKAAPIGDILLKGTVQRGGQKMANDASLFEGDALRTFASSGGVARVAGGRVEIGEWTEVAIERARPLKLVVKSGTIAFSFPEGTPLEIVTPQLDVSPERASVPGSERTSGRVSVQPSKRDRVESTGGGFSILERQSAGKVNRIKKGEVLVASLMPPPSVGPGPAPDMPANPGPLGSAKIATIETVINIVQVSRAATPEKIAHISTPGLPLANNDWVKTVDGQADIKFSDGSELSLNPGTHVRITENRVGNGFLRTIEQTIGSLWFNIQKGTPTTTKLQTPTAVAAIRGTQGTQEVPNDFESTHTLNEGIEDLTEVETRTTITLRAGQSVTAIRGVGFNPIQSLTSPIPRPNLRSGRSAAAAPIPAPGAGASAPFSTVAVIAQAASVGILVPAALVPLGRDDEPPISGSAPQP